MWFKACQGESSGAVRRGAAVRPQGPSHVVAMREPRRAPRRTAAGALPSWGAHAGSPEPLLLVPGFQPSCPAAAPGRWRALPPFPGPPCGPEWSWGLRPAPRVKRSGPRGARGRCSWRRSDFPANGVAPPRPPAPLPGGPALNPDSAWGCGRHPATTGRGFGTRADAPRTGGLKGRKGPAPAARPGGSGVACEARRDADIQPLRNLRPRRPRGGPGVRAGHDIRGTPRGTG